jgi:putative hydroxymethylpyrimidine transport system permease protein
LNPPRLKRYLSPALVLVALVVLWQVAMDVFDVDDYLVPAPLDVASSFGDDTGDIVDHALVTLKEILLGFGVGLVAGVAFALVIHISAVVRGAVFPLLVASQTVPIVVIAPILVVIFGFGLGPKLFIVALICFFPIVITTVDGLQSVDPELKSLMTTLRGSRWDTLRRVEIPAALPSFFSGTRIAATYSSIGAVFAEWSGSASGLGFLIQQSAASLDTAKTFAAVVVLSLLALALVGLVALIERLVVPWAPRRQGHLQTG